MKAEPGGSRALTPSAPTTYAGGMAEGPPLAVFDLDRTLLDGRTIHHLAETFDVFEPAREAWEAYHEGRASWRETKQRVAGLFEGVPVARVEAVCREVGYKDEATRVVGRLRDRGFRVALATASYQPAADRARRDLGLDAAVGTAIEVEGGVVTGRLAGPRFTGECGRWLCKREALRVQRDRLGAEATLAVGDGPNDACMLAEADLGVAVDPEREAAVEAADAVADLGAVPELVDERLDGHPPT